MGISPDFELNFSQTPQMGYGLVPQAVQNMSSEMEAWSKNPFGMLGNRGAVLRHLRMPADEEGSDTKDLEKVWGDIREHLILWGIVIIAVTGRNKSCKGGTNMGFYTLAKKDLYLEDQLTQHGFRSLEILSIPFAHCPEAAKLPRVGLVDPKLTPSTYRFEDERKISGLQWDMVTGALPYGAKNSDEVSETLRMWGQAKIILIEASTPLAHPVTFNAPVEVEGEHDLGNSTFYNTVLDSRTRDHTFALMLLRDPKIRADHDSNEFRRQIFSETPDHRIIFGGETQAITDEGGMEIEVCRLSQEKQEEYRVLYEMSMAPLETMNKLDQAMDRKLDNLYKNGYIPKKTDLAFYQKLRQILSMKPNRCIIPSTQWFRGVKDYFLPYLDSHVIQQYPEILEARRHSPRLY